MRRTALSLSLFVLLGAGLAAAVTFASSFYPTPGPAAGVVSGDFNRDGIADIATANRSSINVDDCSWPYKTWDTVSILPGNEDHTFGTANSFSLGSQSNLTDHRYQNTVLSLVAANLTADDALDLVTSYWMGPAIAHVFLSFGFGEDHVAVSVEARKERGEGYSSVQGFFKRYELIYVVGDERDLIGSRAVYGGYDVYVYPISTTRERMRRMFVEMLERSNALATRPEFYNTLTNNCTSNVVDHVNHIVPSAVPHGIKTILPGYADEVAYSLGLIDNSISLDEARKRFRVNDRARQFVTAPDFSRRIRAN